jgi:hypothetical protein
VGQLVIEFLPGTPDSCGVPVFKVLGHGNCLPGFHCSFSRLDGPCCAAAFWGGGDVTPRWPAFLEAKSWVKDSCLQTG